MTGIAGYAASEQTSKGRLYPEPHPGFRSEFQRDRDRIVHSSAFRRLEYKTQVFVNHEGDMFRTRLTHSLEVSQIGRTAARALKLNEDLTEAVCLAHDLGHTPFGHAGQDALNECMKDYGGFEHNLQSLRVVDVLEEKYPDFPGLNLTFETREGILKHCSMNNAALLGELGLRFIHRKQPGLEAQIANIADEIAYTNHDIDDGLRAGLLDSEQLRSCELFREQHDIVIQKWPDKTSKTITYELIRRMINKVVIDLICNSEVNIKAQKLADINNVRDLDRPLISLSEEVKSQHLELKKFLYKNLYRHDRVEKMSENAREIIRVLFRLYLEHDDRLPERVAVKAQQARAEKGEPAHARIIADYIAGMTDRFAIMESEKAGCSWLAGF